MYCTLIYVSTNITWDDALNHVPECLKDPAIKIKHHALWSQGTRSLSRSYILFFTDEDANYLTMKYPELHLYQYEDQYIADKLNEIHRIS